MKENVGKLSCQLSFHERRPVAGHAGMTGEAERAQEAHERQRLEVEDQISAATRRRGAWVVPGPP